MSGLFEQLGKLVSQRQRDADEQWRDLVTAVADNRKVPAPERVLEVLDACGKSENDLREAVSNLLNRRAWVARVAEFDGVRARLAANQTAFEDAKKTLQEAQLAFEQQREQLAEEAQSLHRRMESIEAARQKLRNGRRTEELSRINDELREIRPLFPGKRERESDEIRQRREELIFRRDEIFRENETTV